MGCTGSKSYDSPKSGGGGGGLEHRGGGGGGNSNTFQVFKDKYQSLGEVQDALRAAGLESSNLILGIDYTKSNTWNGKVTFGGKCLHEISPYQLNPYQETIKILGGTLEAFDDDKLIPVLGFGDSRTTDKAIFKFTEDRPCFRFEEVLQKYNEITPLISFSGPTSFAPLIREAINISRSSKSYHILVIICDGEVTSINETVKAIVDASNTAPLSIITIGVGDGPFGTMERFDDELPERRFDNFQFVNFNEVMRRAENREVDFAVASLQEIPEQFQAIRKLGLLD